MSALEKGDYVVYAGWNAMGYPNWGVHDTVIKCNVVQFDTEAECYAWIDGYDYALVVDR